MTKLWQQLISGLLVLCFAVAGAVGLSPRLHQLAEHSGSGPLHTHRGDASQSVVVAPNLHEHGDGQLHSHQTSCDVSAPCPFRSPVSKDDPFRDFYAAAAPVKKSPPPQTPQHEHHSFVTMLSSGLVEQPLDLPLVSFVPTALAAGRSSPTTQFTPQDWNAQTASRGPPLAQG